MQRDSMFFMVGEEAGLVYAEHVVPNSDAWIGIVMFDRQLKGREPEIHAALEEMFKIASLARLSILVPRTREVVGKLAKRLGFKHEGLMRRAYRSKNGIFEDCDLLGLIVEDLWRYNDRTVAAASSDGRDVLEGTEDARPVCSATMDRIVAELDRSGNGDSHRLDEGPDSDGGDRGGAGARPE